MDKIISGLVGGLIALFVFFSLPAGWQIWILESMRSAGQRFDSSSSEFIYQNKGL